MKTTDSCPSKISGPSLRSQVLPAKLPFDGHAADSESISSPSILKQEGAGVLGVLECLSQLLDMWLEQGLCSNKTELKSREIILWI